jgi:PHP family Zn ribbon phosphoesterase
LTPNTQKLNEVLFNTWNGLLKSDLKGDRGSFEEKLRMLMRELLKEHPSLDSLNKDTEAFLSNNFLKQRMKKCYEKHQQNLKDIKNEVRAIVTRKKKFKKELRNEFYKINSISIADSDNISICLENCSSRTYLDSFMVYYSNEILLNDFANISALKAIVEDIYAEVTSKAFLDKYLEELYEQLSMELKIETYSVEIISGLVKEILAELVEKGFVKNDLSLKLTSDSRIPSLYFQLEQLDKIIHGSTGKWVVLVRMDGPEFKDITDIKIGRVKLYEKNTYDYSKLIDKVGEDSRKPMIIDFFTDKIIAEAEVDAYEKSEAIENGFLEISKVIDSLSLWPRDAIIKEPKFDESYKVIASNRETGNFFLDSRRDPKYVREVKLNENLKGFLKNFDPILNKPYNAFTELESNVANALHWYRKGKMSMDPYDKFLNYIIALESLLTTVEDIWTRKQGIISARAIDVIWILKDYHEEYKDKIKKMYDYRNKIVHEGSTDILNLEDEANELGNITEMALRSVAGKIDKCETLEKFLESNEKEINKKRKEELGNAEKLGIEINKKIRGEGLLKRQTGEPLWKVSFAFEIKDDGNFVVNEVSISSFKKVEGMVKIASFEKDFIIEGNLENIEGKLVIKDIELGVAFELFDLAHKKDINFHVHSFDITKPPKVASRTYDGV